MNYSVSDEEMERIAQELGFEISFDSPEPGVHNTTTGETKHFADYFTEYFVYQFPKEETKIERLSSMKVKKIHPIEIEVSTLDISFSTDDVDGWPKIA